VTRAALAATALLLTVIALTGCSNGHVHAAPSTPGETHARAAGPTTPRRTRTRSPARATARIARLGRQGRLGRRVFFESGCADCHTLIGVHAHGKVGPNLTALLRGVRRRTVIRLVARKVRVGGGGMFPFGIGMPARHIHLVAVFVADIVSRSPAQPGGG
jgi:mono/diheme cytochrome c family protein